jgi:3',5'-cyclic-AMP phosphodiesterase
MLIAQLSDLHLRDPAGLLPGQVDTADLVRRTLVHLLAQVPAPDVVVLTGDLVDGGRLAEYESLRHLLAPLDVPVLLLAGNHDAHGPLRTVFQGPGFEYLQQHAHRTEYALRLGSMRFIALDTVVPGAAHGALSGEQLDWLEARLREDDAPTLLLMHHPPFATGVAHMDAMGLRLGAAGLESVVARHRHVEALLCGHLHRPIQTRFGHTLACTAPGAAHQITLDLRPEGPATYIMEPPGYLLHLWQGQRLVSHNVLAMRFAGPYDFDDF